MNDKNTQLNCKVYDDIKGPSKGEPEENGHVIKIGTAGLSAVIPLPEELLEKMGWNTGDEIEISTTENCFDWGEVQSIVLRNLTKEKSE